MSTETGSGINSIEDIKRLRTVLTEMLYVEQVEEPTIGENPGFGQYVEYRIHVDKTEDHVDIAIDTIKKTLIPTLSMLSTEDYRFPQGDDTTTPIILRVGGLNPNPDASIGAHDF